MYRTLSIFYNSFFLWSLVCKILTGHHLVCVCVSFFLEQMLSARPVGAESFLIIDVGSSTSATVVNIAREFMLSTVVGVEFSIVASTVSDLAFMSSTVALVIYMGIGKATS